MSFKNKKIKDGDYVSYIESLHKNKDINSNNDDIFNKNQSKNIDNTQNKNINPLDKDVTLENKQESAKRNVNEKKDMSSFFMFLFLFIAMLLSYFTDNPKYIAIAMFATILKIIIKNIKEKSSKKSK